MITLPGAEVLGFVLALVRASAWVVVCPPFSSKAIPAMAKIGVAAGLAFVAAPAAGTGVLPASTASFIGAVVEQAVVGLAMGFLVQVAFSVFMSAGSLVDMFSGINLPPSLDPFSSEQVPLIGQLYELLAITLLFTSGADLLLVRGFVSSFSSRQVDMSSLSALVSAATTDLARLFAAAMEIAAPLIAVLFVAQILLGLLAKAAPQMNVFVFGFALQVLLAILGLGMAVTSLPGELVNVVQKAAVQVFG